MRAATLLLALAAVLPSAFANPYLTAPVQSTTCTGNQNCTVSWQDDGKTPTLKDFGPAEISLCVGNSLQQTKLQIIATSLDVSNSSTTSFKLDPSVGPSTGNYFIRVQSLGAKDPATPQYPALAFSAMFNCAGMSGQFNATVQKEIDGASSLPIGSPSSTSLSGSSSSSSPPKSSGSSSSSRAASPTGSAQGNANGVLGLTAGKFLTGVVAAVVGLAML